MLNKLAVSNLAVVEKVEVAFGSGLNVVTGETGAGKSVLIGALELVDRKSTRLNSSHQV